jgi:hypothetical protein
MDQENAGLIPGIFYCVYAKQLVEQFIHKNAQFVHEQLLRPGVVGHLCGTKKLSTKTSKQIRHEKTFFRIIRSGHFYFL